MNLPTISIVTCSYQQARYLEATLQSVFEQGYPQLQYIVIDGGSSDGSVEIIERHAARLSYWVSEPDAGQTDALIKGFRHAGGDIMGWLCSDDLLLPGALHAVGEFFAAHPQVSAVYGDAVWIDEQGRFLRPKKEIPFNRFIFRFDHNYIPQPSMFWRRSLYEACGGLDSRFNVAMDGDLWERFAARGRIAHIPRYLSCMRYYADQKTRRLRARALEENTQVRLRRPAHHTDRAVYPLLHLFAKTARVVLKAKDGAYAAAVPRAHLEWLSQRALRAD